MALFSYNSTDERQIPHIQSRHEMAEFTRTLTFRSSELGTDATLVLTFNDDEIPGIYKTTFPTAFKVSEFGKTGGYSFSVTYKALLGFTRAQISTHDTIEPASTYIPVNVGHKTSLTKEGNLYRFSDPKSIKPSDQIVALNETKGKENIGVGFFDNPQNPPSTILLFENVGAKSAAQIQFTPILRGYITTDYQENAIMRGQVTSPILFNENLTQLEESTIWRITYNAGSASFEIKKEA